MVPEKFGNSLLSHLSISYGHKAVVEAECVFYGQTKNHGWQAAVVHTHTVMENSAIVDRYHFFSCELNQGGSGAFGHTKRVEDEQEEPLLLTGFKDHEAIVHANGFVQVVIGKEALKQLIEPSEVYDPGKNLALLTDEC